MEHVGLAYRRADARRRHRARAPVRRHRIRIYRPEPGREIVPRACSIAIHHADHARFGVFSSGLDGWLHADDRHVGEELAQCVERGSISRVTGHDDLLAINAFEITDLGSLAKALHFGL